MSVGQSPGGMLTSVSTLFSFFFLSVSSIVVRMRAKTSVVSNNIYIKRSNRILLSVALRVTLVGFLLRSHKV